MGQKKKFSLVPLLPCSVLRVDVLMGSLFCFFHFPAVSTETAGAPVRLTWQVKPGRCKHCRRAVHSPHNAIRRTDGNDVQTSGEDYLTTPTCYFGLCLVTTGRDELFSCPRDHRLPLTASRCEEQLTDTHRHTAPCCPCVRLRKDTCQTRLCAHA